MGIEQVLTAPRSPWQNPYCERAIGTLRRECLHHVIVLGDAPELRKRESPDGGKVIALPMVGGPHHRYTRIAA